MKSNRMDIGDFLGLADYFSPLFGYAVVKVPEGENKQKYSDSYTQALLIKGYKIITSIEHPQCPGLYVFRFAISDKDLAFKDDSIASLNRKKYNNKLT